MEPRAAGSSNALASHIRSGIWGIRNVIISACLGL